MSSSAALGLSDRQASSIYIYLGKQLNELTNKGELETPNQQPDAWAARQTQFLCTHTLAVSRTKHACIATIKRKAQASKN